MGFSYILGGLECLAMPGNFVQAVPSAWMSPSSPFFAQLDDAPFRSQLKYHFFPAPQFSDLQNEVVSGTY